MENAVVYARYSSHNQTEQSIEGQLSAAHKYAEAKGYNIIHEYCDRAKTGTNEPCEGSNGRTDWGKIYVSKAFGRKTNREEI